MSPDAERRKAANARRRAKGWNGDLKGYRARKIAERAAGPAAVAADDARLAAERAAQIHAIACDLDSECSAPNAETCARAAAEHGKRAADHVRAGMPVAAAIAARQAARVAAESASEIAAESAANLDPVNEPCPDGFSILCKHVPRHIPRPSWRPEVLVSGEWCANALRFRTESEASESARALLMRWFVPTDSRAAMSPDEPNMIRNADGTETEIPGAFARAAARKAAE